MALLGKKHWDLYTSILGEAGNTFNQKVIQFVRYPRTVSRFREDEYNGDPIVMELPVLCNFNYMRTWPIPDTSATGEIDKQSIQLFINKKALKKLGLLTAHNNLDYDPSRDRFIIDGIRYKAVGDTPASQAPNEDIHYLIIVKREENITTEYKIR